MLRHPGRLLAPGEFVPPAVVGFIDRQLNLDGDELADYAVRSETRHEHLAELRRLYGFRSFSGGAARELVERLRDEAEQAQSNEGLVVEACRDTQTILPATTTIERLCADALVDADPPTPTGCWTASSTSGAWMFRKVSSTAERHPAPPVPSPPFPAIMGSMLDTHTVARSLTDAGLTPAQADAITNALRLAVERGDLDTGAVARSLTDAGFTPVLADAITNAINLAAEHRHRPRS